MRLGNFNNQKGQSLVEMAITAPLLIFFILGIFEVGVAIRGYLVLVNANREITRFAVRPGYLNFSTQADTASSFQKVRDWVDSSVSSQLNLDFSETDGNATMIISHIVVDTGLPCEDIYTNPGNCDCDAFTPTSPYTNTFAIDDLIIQPGIQGMGYQSKRFGPASTTTGSRATKIKYTEVISKLTPQNNKFNCEIIKRGGVPSANNIIVTELFYDQSQLFGFPLISNPFTDPVPLYTHTTMRLAAGSRSNGSESGGLIDNVDKTGPVCDAFPFAVHEDTIDYGNGTKINDKVDIFNGQEDFGTPADSEGWLTWNPDEQDQVYLENELKYSTISLNDFTDARDGDKTLSIDDWVASLPGTNAAVESGAGLLTELIGKKIRIPVWDDFNQGSGGEKDAYHIVGFAWVQIDNSSDFADLDSDKDIFATYLGDAKDDCPDSDVANSPPDAVDDNINTTLSATPITIDIINNDSDLDSDPISIDSIIQPPNGSVTDNGDGTVDYDPQGFIGTESFDYTISDGNGGTDTATVTVTVAP